MITFVQLCEHLTCNQRYNSFMLELHLWDCLTQEEKDIVIVDTISTKVEGLIRVFYPADKYYERIVGDIEYQKLIQQALEKDDFIEVGKLKRMKVYK